MTARRQTAKKAVRRAKRPGQTPLTISQKMLFIRRQLPIHASWIERIVDDVYKDAYDKKIAEIVESLS